MVQIDAPDRAARALFEQIARPFAQRDILGPVGDIKPVVLAKRGGGRACDVIGHARQGHLHRIDPDLQQCPVRQTCDHRLVAGTRDQKGHVIGQRGDGILTAKTADLRAGAIENRIAKCADIVEILAAGQSLGAVERHIGTQGPVKRGHGDGVSAAAEKAVQHAR